MQLLLFDHVDDGQPSRNHHAAPALCPKLAGLTPLSVRPTYVLAFLSAG